MEQRFHLKAGFREIDACEDMEKLRALMKQIISSQENTKAFTREATLQFEKEMEFALSKKFEFK